MAKSSKKRKNNGHQFTKQPKPRIPRFIEIREGEMFVVRRHRDGNLWVFGYDKGKKTWDKPIWRIGNPDALIKGVLDCASFVAAEHHPEKGEIIAVGHVSKSRTQES